MAGFVSFTVFLTILTTTQTLGARIALLPWPNGPSHYFMMEKIGRELEARGHEVQYIFSTMEPYFVKEQKTHKLMYDVRYPVNYLTGSSDSNTSDSDDLNEPFYDALHNICDDLLSNIGILAKLKGTEILFSDNSFLSCGILLQQKIGIPHRVDFSAWALIDPFCTDPYGTPWPVSYIPNDIVPASTNMTFVQRLHNLVAYAFAQYMNRNLMIGTGDKLKAKHSLAPGKSMIELMGEADIVLIPSDFALEWPRPISPNMKIIGNTSPKPASKLPQDLEELMQSSGDQGVILVSFGTMVANLDDNRIQILSKAFSQLNMKIIWRCVRTFPNIKNIMTVKWMPQNDILGHPKVKLFITHGGANSMYEGAYHGVPMLVTPFSGDQFINAQMIMASGIGLEINIRPDSQELTPERLVQLATELAENPKYRTNAARVSKLLKDRPRTPSQEGADWIEFVLRHKGTQHLRPESLNLSFYQYFLLDVAAFFALISGIVLFIFVMFCRCLKNVCCSRKATKEKKH